MIPALGHINTPQPVLGVVFILGIWFRLDPFIIRFHLLLFKGCKPNLLLSGLRNHAAESMVTTVSNQKTVSNQTTFSNQTTVSNQQHARKDPTTQLTFQKGWPRARPASRFRALGRLLLRWDMVPSPGILRHSCSVKWVADEKGGRRQRMRGEGGGGGGGGDGGGFGNMMGW